MDQEDNRMNQAMESDYDNMTETPYTNYDDMSDYQQMMPSDESVPSYNQPQYTEPRYPSTGIGPVIVPSYPGAINYAAVRFLHAAQGYPAVTITVGARMEVEKLEYLEASEYSRIMNGYRTVTVAAADNPRNIVFRKSVTFTSGSQITLAIANSANGLQLVEVSDQLCSNKSWDTACLRFVNLSYGSGSFDISLENGETAFADVEFTEVTPFKQVNEGNYVFTVFEVAPGIQPRTDNEPLLSFPLNVKGNEMVTVYLVGSTYSTPGLEPVILMNS